MDSIYWVISRDCNQRCAHCYNDSAPGAQGLSREEAAQVVAHFPSPDEVPVQRIILSGGEPLVWPELLFTALDHLYARYGERTMLWVQTNGDLLDESMLRELMDHHVQRIDIASQDSFHPRSSRDRLAGLEAMFRGHGFRWAGELEDQGFANRPSTERVYHYWGANPDTWIGPLWPRGRARRHGITKAGPQDRFCDGWSGAKGFLDVHEPGSEVNIQLADLYPCCPMTAAPIGTLLEEPLLDILARVGNHPIFQSLNTGNPEAMGAISHGIDEATGCARSDALGNHCLWCDEFFMRHAPELLRFDCPTARKGDDAPAKKKVVGEG